MPTTVAIVAATASAATPPNDTIGIATIAAASEPTVPGAIGERPMPRHVASVTDANFQNVVTMRPPGRHGMPKSGAETRKRRNTQVLGKPYQPKFRTPYHGLTRVEQVAARQGQTSALSSPRRQDSFFAAELTVERGQSCRRRGSKPCGGASGRGRSVCVPACLHGVPGVKEGNPPVLLVPVWGGSHVV